MHRVETRDRQEESEKYTGSVEISAPPSWEIENPGISRIIFQISTL